MKRLAKYPQNITEKWEVEWIVDIFPKFNFVKGATSIIDTGSNEYQNFISSMITEFEHAGFELYNDSKYTHPSNTEGSQSDYYTFLKIEDYVIIEVIVHVRISDHPMKDKRWGTVEERRQKYLTKISRELKDEYELEDYPYSIPVDIIFRDDENSEDDRYLKSYTAAMFRVRKEIKELQDQIEEWKSKID